MVLKVSKYINTGRKNLNILQRTTDLYQPVDESQSLNTCIVICILKKIRGENRHRRTLLSYV